MAERPFRDYAEAELIELLHSRQGDVSYWVRQEREFRKEYGGKADGDRWMYGDEDYQSIEHEISRSRNEVAEVQAEFDERRKERAERRLAREERSGNTNSGCLVPLVCSCRPERRIKVTQKVHEAGPVICGLCHQSFELDRGPQAGHRPE